MPSFEAMTAFGPLLTTVAEIGRPSDDAMSCDADAVVRAVHDDPDDVAEAKLARKLEELRAVAQRADLGGDDEEDLVRDGEHRHGAVVVAGVVVDDDVGVVIARPAQRGKQQVDDTRSDSAGSVPHVRTRTPLAAWVLTICSKAASVHSSGGLSARSARPIRYGTSSTEVTLPTPTSASKQEDLGARLLAQGDRHVHGDRRLADAALRSEDADDVALAGDRRGAAGPRRWPTRPTRSGRCRPVRMRSAWSR